MNLHSLAQASVFIRGLGSGVGMGGVVSRQSRAINKDTEIFRERRWSCHHTKLSLPKSSFLSEVSSFFILDFHFFIFLINFWYETDICGQLLLSLLHSELTLLRCIEGIHVGKANGY